MAVSHRKIYLKQKKVVFYRQLDVLYNLSRSKTKFGLKSFILETWFSRKPIYEGLRGILTLIFGISMVDNLQPNNFYQKSDWTVGTVPSSDLPDETLEKGRNAS